MGYDLLSEKVDGYARERRKLDDDLRSFSGREGYVQEALPEAQINFTLERAELEERERELEEERTALSDMVNGELEKINETKKITDAVSGRKYGGDMHKASDKCQEYIAQLEELIDELGESVLQSDTLQRAEQREAYPSTSSLETVYTVSEEGNAAGLFHKKENPSVKWKCITEPHSPMEDAKATNPNYDPHSIEWSQNCQRCVPAYEMRRRGYDVQVKPRPMESTSHWFLPNTRVAARDDHLSHHPFDVWVPPEAVHCLGQLALEEQMKAWGDGARAEVMVVWEGGHGSGHVFVAEQINGSTHFIDPQSGKDGVAYYFDYCDLSRIYICRTDDKEISEHIKDCCL